MKTKMCYPRLSAYIGGRSPGALLPQVRVVAVFPVFAARGENVDYDGVLDCFHHVGDIRGDGQRLARLDDLLAVFHVELQSSALDGGDLLVNMAVLGDHRVFLQMQARDGEA